MTTCAECGALIEEETAPLCQLCRAEERWGLADEAPNRAALERRLRSHLFSLCDTAAVTGDYHAVSVGLLQEAARVYGPCQDDAEYQRIADHVDMLASEFGGARPF